MQVTAPRPGIAALAVAVSGAPGRRQLVVRFIHMMPRVWPNFGAQSSFDGICPGNKRLSRTTSAPRGRSVRRQVSRSAKGAKTLAAVTR